VQTIHESLAILAIAFALACLAIALIAWASGRPYRIVIDRLILLGLLALTPAVVTGGAIALLRRPPPDPLHFLYAVAVFVPLPLARYLGRSGSLRRRGGYVALGAFVTLGLLVRLFQTGA
jgi:hypothetical protein